MVTISSLFTVGSFAPGMPHYPKLEPFVESVEAGAAVGSVYRAPSGLIAFSSSGAQKVEGALVSLRSPELALAVLDAYHGVAPGRPEAGLYARGVVEVSAASGRVEAAVYEMNPRRLSPGARPIADADWRASLAQKAPLYARLTERQKAYVLKLGSAGARAVVPIDLQLYRELLSLELVADKGRRLALTSLGQEVARMLK